MEKMPEVETSGKKPPRKEVRTMRGLGTLTVVVAFVTGFGFCGTAMAYHPLVNPGADDGLSGWTTKSNILGIEIDSTAKGQGFVGLESTFILQAQVLDADSDGDGLPDADDSCPFAVDLGIDSDGDGVDDACDPDAQSDGS